MAWPAPELYDRASAAMTAEANDIRGRSSSPGPASAPTGRATLYILCGCLCRTVSEQAALWDVHGAGRKKAGSLSGTRADPGTAGARFTLPYA